MRLCDASTNRDVTITNAHRAFEGTPYAEAEFSIDLHIPTFTETAKMEAKADRKTSGGRTDMVALLGVIREKFNSAVRGWTGFTAANGQAVPCDDAGKTQVWEHNNKLAMLILEAVRIEDEALIAEGADAQKN